MYLCTTSDDEPEGYRYLHSDERVAPHEANTGTRMVLPAIHSHVLRRARHDTLPAETPYQRPANAL